LALRRIRRTQTAMVKKKARIKRAFEFQWLSADRDQAVLV
jgi:hypothetical protein